MESPEKYALITGASSGISWYISDKLAKKGYSIIAVSNKYRRIILSIIQGSVTYPVTVSCNSCPAHSYIICPDMFRCDTCLPC